MENTKTETGNAFHKTNYEDKLSKIVKLVKSIEKWVMETLKCEGFLCNDIA